MRRGAPDAAALFVGHEDVFRVAGADAAQVPDVMAQQGDGEMQPVRLALLFDQDAPLEDRLSDQGDHDGVMTVMIERVAVGDPLDHQLRGGSGGRGVVGCRSPKMSR